VSFLWLTIIDREPFG